MIEKLKQIHQDIYAPSITPSGLDIDVSSIQGPYLFTQNRIEIREVDSVDMKVSIPVWNIGDQPLRIHHVDIQGTAKRWLTVAQKGKQSRLISPNTEESIIGTFELQRYFNQPPDRSVGQIKIRSNSTSDFFSTISIHVALPKSSFPKLKLPEFVDFGEIPVWKLVLTLPGENAPDRREFFLVLYSIKNAPSRLQLKRGKKGDLRATLKVKGRQLYYDLSLDEPGFVRPKTKSGKYAKLYAASHSFAVENLSNVEFTGDVSVLPASSLHQSSEGDEPNHRNSTSWLSCSLPKKIPAGAREKVSLLADVTKIQVGRNLGRLNFRAQSGKTVDCGSVWVCSVVTLRGESTFQLEETEQEIDHSEELPEASPKLPIKVTPKQLKILDFPFFEDVSFHFPHNVEKQVFLVGDFNDWRSQQLLLDKRESDLITTLSLPDNTYFYRYEADGETRLEPQHFDECFICSHGLASRRTIKRCEWTLKIRPDKNTELPVNISTSVPWLKVSPEHLVTQSDKKKVVTVRLDPLQLKVGLNQALIQFESPDFPERIHSLPVSIIAQTSGIVPYLEKVKYNLGSSTERDVTEKLFMKIIGQGKLKGRLIPENSASLISQSPENLETGGSYRIEDGNLILEKANPLSCNVTLDMNINLSNNQPIDNTHIYFVSNCYLSNRRVYPLDFHYAKPHLIASPPALHFPNVFLGDSPQSCKLTVSCSNSREIDLEVQLPKALQEKKLLTLKSVTENRCQLILNPQVLQETGIFSDILIVRDGKSGLSERVPVFIRVIDSTAEISVAPIQSNIGDALELKIRNSGANALKLFNLSFAEKKFHCVPQFTPNTILRPNETKHFLLKAVPKAPFLIPLTVSDTLILSLNDQRNLRFQHPIQLKIPTICAQFFRNVP